MFKNLPTLQKLIRQLQHVPYLASKNLYRVVMYFLTSDRANVHALCQAILEAKDNVKPCTACFNWTEDSAGLCSFCSSPKRDKSLICVVETWLDLAAIEKVGEYNGLYHVLGGALCPLEGVGPDELYIDALVKRIELSHTNGQESSQEDKKACEKIREIIFATNPTPEGEATASFIASKMNSSDIVISKLASGVPIGSNVHYMDRVTISKALSGRRPF